MPLNIPGQDIIRDAIQASWTIETVGGVLAVSDVAVARASDIHPNPTGTEYISRTIYQALSAAF